jgi:hypothetical protein
VLRSSSSEPPDLQALETSRSSNCARSAPAANRLSTDRGPRASKLGGVRPSYGAGPQLPTNHRRFSDPFPTFLEPSRLRFKFDALRGFQRMGMRTISKCALGAAAALFVLGNIVCTPLPSRPRPKSGDAGHATPAHDSPLPSFLMRAVFVGERLWLLSDTGDLSSITEGQRARVKDNSPKPVLDLCARNGRPVVIAQASTTRDSSSC